MKKYRKIAFETILITVGLVALYVIWIMMGNWWNTVHSAPTFTIADNTVGATKTLEAFGLTIHSFTWESTLVGLVIFALMYYTARIILDLMMKSES